MDLNMLILCYRRTMKKWASTTYAAGVIKLPSLKSVIAKQYFLIK